MNYFDRVAVTTATTGTGTITLGAVLDTNFFTFAEQGASDTDQVYYMLNEGGDVEIGIGTIGGSVTTLSRDSVIKSRISGAAGTTKMSLAGGAQVRCIAPSQAFDSKLEADFSNIDNTADAVAALKIGQYQTKSANFTAVYADMASTFRVTASGSTTCSLTAAATLGLSWWCEIKADGGTVVIDPNASELINGASTYTVYDGQSVVVACDGTNFQIVSATGVEEHIETRTFTTQSDVTFTGLGDYRVIFATLFVATSTDNTPIYAQTSVSGTFSTLAAGYETQVSQSFASTVNGVPLDGMRVTMPIGNAGSEAGVANITFFELNQSGRRCFFLSDAFVLNEASSLPVKASLGGSRVDTSARDGLRFLPGAGTITGFISLKGIRG